MELPSVRELELESLLREKDIQLAEVTDEIAVLRQYLSKQPGPSTAEPVTLPPALLSVLMPHINAAAHLAPSGSTSTVTAALTQRVRVLQDENDELYDLLKHSETGKLKDEVLGLRRVVDKLETALKESHNAILSLSSELDKAYETIVRSSRVHNSNPKPESHSNSPLTNYHAMPHADGGASNSSNHKPPPTEPRAHKRPRLSEPQASPPASQPTSRLAPSLPQKPQHYHHGSNHNGSNGNNNGNHTSGPTPRNEHGRDHGRHMNEGGRSAKGAGKMEVDGGDDRTATPSNRDRDRPRERERHGRERDRDRDRERERGGGGGGGGGGTKERERPRESGKEWDRDGNKVAHSRRNGHAGGGNGSSGRGSGGGASGRSKGNDRNNGGGGGANSNANVHMSDNRTLQERLGL